MFVRPEKVRIQGSRGAASREAGGFVCVLKHNLREEILLILLSLTFSACGRAILRLHELEISNFAENQFAWPDIAPRGRAVENAEARAEASMETARVACRDDASGTYPFPRLESEI